MVLDFLIKDRMEKNELFIVFRSHCTMYKGLFFLKSLYSEDILNFNSLLKCRYGFYGDVITESEKYRWMGPARYDYAGTNVFLRHR